MDYIHKTSKIGFLGSSFDSKCKGILEDGAIEIIKQPTELSENLVCVIDYNVVGEALYIDNKKDFDLILKSPSRNNRQTRWFTWGKAKLYAE